jgi:outer membrane protein OmpA-like peptidoglycan-associated protein
VAPASAPPPAPQTQAAPPARADTAAASARLAFAGDSADLPAETRAQLRGVVEQLRRGQDARLRIEGFASGEDANKARRLSLSRALAVRAFLMDEGLSSTRMDVYARGGQAEGGPSDRVDLTVFRR